MFDSILAHIEKENYEPCDLAACELYKDLSKKCEVDPNSKRYVPYAVYFKLLSAGYRNWQITYDYTHIRAKFSLAYHRFSEGIGPEPQPEDLTFRDVFENLSEALKEYTWCENSFINNDPFALQRHAVLAIDKGEAALAALSSHFSDPNLHSIGKALQDYVRKNLHLHEGLRACAELYCTLLTRRSCSPAEYERLIHEATVRHEELSNLSGSPELPSELYAHIAHIRRHYARLTSDPPPTFLKVSQGTLVLVLSASCDLDVVYKIIDSANACGTDAQSDDKDPTKFERQLKDYFENVWGITVKSFRPSVLHDIFQTTFGENLLKGLQFDLGDVTLSLLNKKYTFQTHAVLSALGACAVYFSLDISPQQGELSVEEVRSLQSLICPHAGQIGLEGTSSRGKDSKCNFEFIERMDLGAVRTILSQYAENKIIKETLEKIDKLVEEHMLQRLETGTGQWGTGISEMTESLINIKTSSIIGRDVADALSSSCDSLRYLSRLAARHLHGIEFVFRGIAGGSISLFSQLANQYRTARTWKLQSDTGWYSYLYAIQIDEVDRHGMIVRERVNFSQIRHHPDTPGLLLDTREARASFDDWRFMKTDELIARNDAKPSQVTPRMENLAHIRSHDTDAFFASEYRSFMYFPDDPQFLTDQYEKTIELMIYLDTSLKGYGSLAQTVGLCSAETTAPSLFVRPFQLWSRAIPNPTSSKDRLVCRADAAARLRAARGDRTCIGPDASTR
jgi:hypothetical protein